ncbi:hypothetical protein PC39_02295 [Salinisphaera sp. PC39]
MYGLQPTDRFQLQDDSSFHDEIDSIFGAQPMPFIGHRERLLSFKAQVAYRQLLRQGFLIKRLQKTRA